MSNIDKRLIRERRLRKIANDAFMDHIDQWWAKPIAEAADSVGHEVKVQYGTQYGMGKNSYSCTIKGNVSLGGAVNLKGDFVWYLNFKGPSKWKKLMYQDGIKGIAGTAERNFFMTLSPVTPEQWQAVKSEVEESFPNMSLYSDRDNTLWISTRGDKHNVKDSHRTESIVLQYWLEWVIDIHNKLNSGISPKADVIPFPQQ